MTIQSFNARLRKCDPRLRIRTRTGWKLLKSEGFSMIGFFRGHRYLNIAGIAGDLPYHTRGTVWRIERFPGIKEPQKYIHSRMRRGRSELTDLLMGQRIVKLHRHHRQLLKI